MIQFWLPKTASWGPFGAWFGQIRADSGRFRQIRAGPFWTSALCSRPDPPFVGPTCLQSVPKGPQNIRKVALDVLPGPHKISMDKIPALGFFISANLKKIKRCPLSASRSLCNNHCKFKKKHLSYQSEGRSFSGCGGLAWASSITDMLVFQTVTWYFTMLNMFLLVHPL